MVRLERKRRRQGPVVIGPALTVTHRSNEVWTADFKGWYLLGNGMRVEPLTVRDSASRFVLVVELMRQQNVEDTIPVFRRLFRENGKPWCIRVDNGSPFGSKGAAGLTRLSVWWIKQGIKVEFIRPGHPEDNANHEQFHGVLKKETINPPAQTWRGQQRRTKAWVEEYNEERPHEGLEMRKPADDYEKNPQRFSEKRGPIIYPLEWESRLVRANGMIHLRGRKRYVGEAFGGERVGLKRVRKGDWRVYFGQMLIGELREDDREGMRPAKHRRRKSR